MPALECPLGADCSKGPDGSIWKTQDVAIEIALKFREDHLNYAHKTTVARVHKPDGVSGDPVQHHNLNENKGVQGANFVNSPVYNPVFNIQSPERRTYHDYYQKIKLIGKGSFGEAWIVKPKNVGDNDRFIMKEITCTEENVETGKNEITLLKNCHHERIVSYIEDFYKKSKIQIIMEYCEGGDLAKFIEERTEPLEVEFILEWVIQLTTGVKFIHGKNIIHRDLKPENIFLTSENKLKIGDFGVSKGLGRTSGVASTRTGTPVYMAPEILGGDKYNTMADIWSLGIIIFEIITFKKPFHGHDWLQAITKE